MELIKAGFEIIEQESGLNGVYKAAELPGRICYWSMDKMTPESAKPFIEGLMEKNHGAPLEHGTVYLRDRYDVSAIGSWGQSIGAKYNKNKFSIVNTDDTCDIRGVYVTTNLRVLFENGWLDDLKYLCEPTPYHEKRIMVRFTIDRFTGEEYLRHRVASFNRESTRYVNYSKGKFGGGNIKFIEPCWLSEREEELKDSSEREFYSFCKQIANSDDDLFTDIDYFVFALKTSEWVYNHLTSLGWQAQQARTVLPCAINSPLIKTAAMHDWVHFFQLRALGTTGAPHPQAKELAWPLMVEFLKRNYLTKDELLIGLSGTKLEEASKLLNTIEL